MSGLGRAFLRMAACAALRGQTALGEAIYDSRIAALDPTSSFPTGDITGTIAVHTEQSEGDALSSSEGGPPFRPEIELVLEIAMHARVAIDGGGYDIGTPESDDELETTLDLLETQAEVILFRSQSAASVAFRKLAKRVSRMTSIRFTDPSSSAKLAIRYVTYKTEIHDPEIAVFDGSLTGLARLPQLFAEVAAAWVDGSPEKEKAVALAAALPNLYLPRFSGVDASVGLPGSSENKISASWSIQQ